MKMQFDKSISITHVRQFYSFKNRSGEKKAGIQFHVCMSHGSHQEYIVLKNWSDIVYNDSARSREIS